MKRKNNLLVDKVMLEELYKLYSISDICKILDIGRCRIDHLFSMYGIPKKTQSEIQKSETVKQKQKETIKEKYGDNWGFNSEKYKETIKEKYGVSNISNNNEILNKIKKTKLEKYGDENYNNISKNIKTIKEKYDVNNVSKLNWVKEKKKQTMFEKYGVETNFQRIDVQRKGLRNLYRVKKYYFPSGRETIILGYEGIMLDLLLSDGFLEDDIVTNDECPNIEWFDTNNKKHNHIPDIFIKSLNKIIEVKGDYTGSEKFIETIKLKKKFAEELGFTYVVYVIDGKTKKIKYEIN